MIDIFNNLYKHFDLEMESSSGLDQNAQLRFCIKPKDKLKYLIKNI